MEKVFAQLGLVTVVAVLIGGFAATPSYGQARPITIRESVPLSGGGAEICGGEEVLFTSGNVNFVSHVTIGPDGMFEYFVSHVNFQGARGVFTTSGNSFVLIEADSGVAHISQISANVFQSQVHGNLITPGNEMNIVVEIVIHTTINANGEPTSTVVHEEVKCVG